MTRGLVLFLKIFRNIQKALVEKGSSVEVRFGKPLDVFKKLTGEYEIKNVITNRDYEPYSKTRDAIIEKLLAEKGIGFHTFKDHVIFETNEVTKSDGSPYVVYTPYMKRWKEQFIDSKTICQVMTT